MAGLPCVMIAPAIWGGRFGAFAIGVPAMGRLAIRRVRVDGKAPEWLDESCVHRRAVSRCRRSKPGSSFTGERYRLMRRPLRMSAKEAAGETNLVNQQ